VWWDVGPGRYSRFLRHVLGHSQAARIETQVEDAWRRLTKEGVTCLEAVALRLGIDL
jgi:phosphohistidine phosphatase SixA